MLDTRNRRITKPVDGWTPPDTNELERINNLLQNIISRIHSLRIAFMLNDDEENGRIRRAMASRKAAVKKAYKMGLRHRCGKYCHV